MGADMDLVGRMAPRLELLLPCLDERARRLVLGSVALAAGDGGVTAVARAAGAAWQTVADGAAELESGAVVHGRVRRAGGGDVDPDVLGGGLYHVDEIGAAGRDPFTADVEPVRALDR